MEWDVQACKRDRGLAAPKDDGAFLICVLLHIRTDKVQNRGEVWRIRVKVICRVGKDSKSLERARADVLLKLDVVVDDFQKTIGLLSNQTNELFQICICES